MNWFRHICQSLRNYHWSWTNIAFFLTLAGMGACLVVLYIPMPQPQMPLASEVYDIHHNLVTTFYHQNRRHVPLKAVPDFLQKAFLAVEDHRFFEHHGINPGRILKAAWYDITHRSLAQGASTITQQLVKNAYLTHERSFIRKIKELFLTIKLELHLSKAEIFELYLNQIYFGHGAYGVRVAAETYFGKDLGELNQAEMALLAGLPKGPAYYSPYTHPEAARKRLRQTLQRMLACKYITEAEYQRYSRQPLTLPGLKTRSRQAPYFLDLLQDELTAIFPKDPGIVYTGGLVIESTLDLNLMKAATTALNRGLPKLLVDKNGLVQPQGALIAMDPKTGEIRALIGGTDYGRSQFNRAIQAKRQPGSAFKPILYAAALSKGYTLASLIDRSPKIYQLDAGTYQPTDGANLNATGLLSLRDALASSSNVVAVKLLDTIGIDSVLSYAARMGIISKLPATLSLALGSGEVTPLELSTAYIPLANNGISIKPTTIRRILDRNGNVLYKRQIQPQKVLNPGVAYLVTQALTGVFQAGGTAANIGHRVQFPAAGKTGTTEANRDAWFVGYTPELLTSVFVGCDHNERSLPGAGNRIAAPIWADFMNQVVSPETAPDFPMPKEVVKAMICKESGEKATPFCPGRSEYFLAGTEPAQYCTLHRFVQRKICARSGLLPGPYCTELEEKEFLLGEQPASICDQCRPQFKIFDWMQRIFKWKP
ncbi:MAG TPA: PBP1A family penicillin-binding protein [Bacillota bacterium]|nr:PBP1A family penicillin-binding protein [Bacillota bacterium]